MGKKLYLPIILLVLLVSAGCLSSSTQNQEVKTAKVPSELYSVKVDETELITQFHGDPINADLRLFMAGNQFLVMDRLVEEFQSQNPGVNVFYVTIPPGKLLKWITAGGIEIKSERTTPGGPGFKLTVLPDVYTSVNKAHMDKLQEAGLITRYYTYAHNRLVLMASSKDPLAGKKLNAKEFYDLMSDPSVTISEPDILTQGIERHIWQMYTDASKMVFPGDTAVQELNPKMFKPDGLSKDPLNSLRRIVYNDKVKDGKTLLTEVHHIETPDYIRSGEARLGPVWVTEVLFQKNRLGATDIAAIEIDGLGPDGKYLDRRQKVNYVAAIVEGTMDPTHRKTAEDWVTFLRRPKAQEILVNVGFMPATQGELEKPHVYG
jgi:ABC-type molybdate transport system substrate-binding protein